MQACQLVETILAKDSAYQKSVEELQLKTIASHATNEEIKALIGQNHIDMLQALKIRKFGGSVDYKNMLQCVHYCKSPEKFKEFIDYVNDPKVIRELSEHPGCWGVAGFIYGIDVLVGTTIAYNLLDRVSNNVPENTKKAVIDAALAIHVDPETYDIKVTHPFLYLQPEIKKRIIETCTRDQAHWFMRNIAMVGCVTGRDLDLIASRIGWVPRT